MNKIQELLKNRFVRYVLVGGTAYCIEIVTIYLLHEVLGLSPVQSVAISFWIGFVAVFGLQKFITFQDYQREKKEIAKQLVGYSFLVAWNYAFTLITVTIFSGKISVFVIRTVVIAIMTTWNFVIYRKLFT